LSIPHSNANTDTIPKIERERERETEPPLATANTVALLPIDGYYQFVCDWTLQRTSISFSALGSGNSNHTTTTTVAGDNSDNNCLYLVFFFSSKAATRPPSTITIERRVYPMPLSNNENPYNCPDATCHTFPETRTMGHKLRYFIIEMGKKKKHFTVCPVCIQFGKPR